MNIKKQKKFINIDWYSQAADVKPLYISYPYHACFKFTIKGRTIPYNYHICAYFKHNFMQDYISKESLTKNALYYYGRQIKNKNFIQDLSKNWKKKYVRPHLNLVNEIISQDLSKLSSTETLKLFKQLNQSYGKVWSESIFLDNFDYYGETILQQALAKENKKITPVDLEILLAPPEPTFAQQEKVDLLTTKDLSKHQQKYFWIHNDYSHVGPLPLSYFRKELKSSQLKEKTKIINWFKTLPTKKKKIIKKYKLSSNFVNTINFLALLTNFRDTRKSYQQLSSQAVKDIAQQLSLKYKYPFKKLERLFYWEVESALIKPNKTLFKKAEDRYLGVFYYFHSINKYDTYPGKSGSQLNKKIQQIIKQKSGLKGQAAYPGLVQGKVKIINGRADFKKMKPGDILVAPNTRPEYLPIMKIAGAIISAEGGITCHASIVSRELKIPCLVGVQSALTSLKDNQFIEVDAQKGMINIL